MDARLDILFQAEKNCTQFKFSEDKIMSKYGLGEDLDYGTYEITSTACGKTKPLPDQTKRVVTFEGLITDSILSRQFIGNNDNEKNYIPFEPSGPLASRSCTVEGSHT